MSLSSWFNAGTEYRDSLAGLVAYLPVGDLEVLIYWRQKWIPYRSDTDTGLPDGKYDPLQNYNGADLTIKAKGGDCESIAAVFSEVIRAWHGWRSFHICMVYANNTAHDVAFFIDPNGRTGWIDGGVHYGHYEDMKDFYACVGWNITYWWEVNDLGEKIRSIED